MRTLRMLVSSLAWPGDEVRARVAPADRRKVHSLEKRAGVDWAAGVVRSELARAETKASILVGLVAGVVAVAVTVLTARPVPLVPALIGWASVLCLTGAVVLLLSVVRPRMGSGGLVAWSRARSVDQVYQAVGAHDPNQDACDLVWLSAVAVAKYDRVRVAVDLAQVGVVGLVVAGLMTIGGVS